MEDKLDPLNLDILLNDPSIFSRLHEVSVRDIYEQGSTEFHRDGLFSSLIFGQVGSTERTMTFGYISLGIKIMHPRVFKEAMSMSSLYTNIVAGKEYAVFDTKLKDFIKSTPEEGNTGYSFFMKHFSDIKFRETESEAREFSIKFIRKHPQQSVMYDKWLVLPAGLRDYTVAESGKPMENEINGLYRKLISVSRTALQFKQDVKAGEFLDSVRFRLQRAINNIHDYIEDILDGKHGFVQGKWAKRAILYGTRNVITSVPIDIMNINEKDGPNALSSMVGIYQGTKGILPTTIFQVRTRFLHDIFDPESSQAMLIDTKSFKRKSYKISEKSRASWVTDDGLESTINKLAQDSIKNAPIVIDGHYLLLVHDKGTDIRILANSEMYPDIPTSELRPITYGELFYLSIWDVISDYPTLLTRYPVLGLGSTDPAIPYLKSTLKSRVVNVWMDDKDESRKATSYPIIGERWLNSLTIPTMYLEALGADFDGKLE